MRADCLFNEMSHHQPGVDSCHTHMGYTHRRVMYTSVSSVCGQNSLNLERNSENNQKILSVLACMCKDKQWDQKRGKNQFRSFFINENDRETQKIEDPNRSDTAWEREGGEWPKTETERGRAVGIKGCLGQNVLIPNQHHRDSLRDFTLFLFWDEGQLT